MLFITQQYKLSFLLTKDYIRDIFIALNDKRMKNKNKLLYYLRFFKKYTLLIILGVIFLIIAKMAATIEPLFLRNIIDNISGNKALETIWYLLALYFGTKLLSIIFEFLRDYILSPVIMGVTKDIEVKVFNHLLKLPASYHADQKSGSAVRAVGRGSRAITFVLDFGITQLLPPIFELIFVTILLLRLYTWQYGTITLITITLYAWFTIWSTEKRTKYREKGNKRDDAASGVLIDSITNIETVKYFNNERVKFNLFSKIKKQWHKLMVKNNRLFALIFSIQGIILSVGLGLILILVILVARL